MYVNSCKETYQFADVRKETCQFSDVRKETREFASLRKLTCLCTDIHVRKETLQEPRDMNISLLHTKKLHTD